MSKSQSTNMLPSIPAPPSKFLTYVTSHRQAHPRDLVQPYLDYEGRLREIFAQQPDHSAIKDPYVNTVPIFADGEEEQLKIFARDLSQEDERQHNEYLMPLKSIDRKPHGSSALVPSLNDFKTNFGIFTEGSLSELDWSNVVAAGSSVVTSLLPVPGAYAESKRTKREWYHERFAPASDVDLFLYGLTEEQAIEKIKQIERCVRDSVLQETTTVRTKNTVTIASQYPIRHVQIVLRIYKSVSEILTGFDVDCSCVAYDGKQVYASPRALVAFMTQMNIIDLSRRSPSYENRLQKYAKRGFEVHWPPLDRSKIDPTIFERNFARTTGLARLLVYEKLPENSDREAYINERREERGRPGVQSHFRQRHELTGNIKQHATDEVNEGIEEDAVANYHTFTIPYGPKFNARRIEKLLYTKDLLLNAEWNKPQDRNVDLHRHPAFFGSVDDVVGDCCGSCPDPQTKEEYEMAEAESKTFVRGAITFMKDDPGRQAIGSFNPINDNQWTKMAYVGDMEHLCQAIVQDDLDKVKILCEKEDKINLRDHCGRSPLQLAVSVSTPRIVQHLVDNGARLIARLADGKTSLHLAAMRGGPQGLEMVRILLRRSEANEEAELERDSSAAKQTEGGHPLGSAENDGSDGDDDSVQNIRTSADANDAITEGSFVKVNENANEKEVEPLEYESAEGPDIYNVNVYSWDAQVTALHYAVIMGHTEIVKELVQSFGADVLVPVKLLSNSNSRPASAILTPVLSLRLPPTARQEMVSILLQLGATSSQADMEKLTALHRFVKAHAHDLVKILVQYDGPAAQKAINHFVPKTNYHYYSKGVLAPLVTAIKTHDFASVQTLIDAGAKPSISFQDVQKSHDNKMVSFAREKFGENVEQPIILALMHEQLDAVRLLLEAGADVNTLTTNAYTLLNAQQPMNYYGNNVAESLLDLTRSRIKYLNQWDARRCTAYETENAEPKPLPPSQVLLAGVAEGTFKAYRLFRDIKAGEEEYAEQSRQYSRWRREYNEKEGIDSKRRQLQDTIQSLETLESLLISHGARSFEELHPSHAEANEKLKENANGPRMIYNSQMNPWEFQPSIGYQQHGMGEDVRLAYDQLFEGAWSGNMNLIRGHTVYLWGPDKDQTPLSITTRSDDGFTPFTLAALRGHMDCAKGILEICALQYHNPDDPDANKSYHIRGRDPEEDDNEDNEGDSENDDELDIEAKEQDAPLTTDIAQDLNQKVKQTVKPEQAIDAYIETERIREIAPMGLPSKDRVKQYDNINLLQYAIITQKRKLFDWILDLKLSYKNASAAPETLLAEPIVDVRSFEIAMQFDRIDMLGEMIKRAGVALPFESLVKKSGVQLPEKHKYYQGLTVYGSKRKNWAQRGKPVYAGEDVISMPPLLHASLQASPRILHWILGTEPKRLYTEFAEAHEDAKHILGLRKAEGGFEGQLNHWFRARGNLALHLAILSRDENYSFRRATHPQSLEAVGFLARSFPELLDARSPKVGLTPLMIAFACRDKEAAKVLINAGANQTYRDKAGNNLIHFLFNSFTSPGQKKRVPEQVARDMIALVDPRILPDMFLERYHGKGSETFLTPLAKRCFSYTQILNNYTYYRAEQHDFYDFPEMKNPNFYPEETKREEYEECVADLKLLMDLSPSSEHLGALDGAGDTIAHLMARRHMFPLFKVIIEREPTLLWRENAVGQTPYEIARDAWLTDKVSRQPGLSPMEYEQFQYNEPRWSVAFQRPGYFVALQRYEEYRAQGREHELKRLTSVEKMYNFVLDVAGRKDHKMERRLVSLNEANVVAERLAIRERKARNVDKRLGPRGRSGNSSENDGEEKTDDVENILGLCGQFLGP